MPCWGPDRSSRLTALHARHGGSARCIAYVAASPHLPYSAACLLQFLAADLGGVRYPQYSVQRSRSAFASRAALLRYERALRHAEALTNAVEVCQPVGAWSCKEADCESSG